MKLRKHLKMILLMVSSIFLLNSCFLLMALAFADIGQRTNSYFDGNSHKLYNKKQIKMSDEITNRKFNRKVVYREKEIILPEGTEIKENYIMNIKPHMEIPVRIEVYSGKMCGSKENVFVFEAYYSNEEIFQKLAEKLNDVNDFKECKKEYKKD